MEGSINIELDELSKLALLHRTKHEIADKIVDEFVKKSEFEELVNSIKIDPRIIRERVQSRMVDEIIKKWVKDTYDEIAY